MLQPHVPLRIMSHTELTYQQKAFLLWCWIERTNDERCELLSRRQNCHLRDRSIRWYIQYFQVGATEFYKNFNDLKSKGVIKTEREGTRNEVTYVDFTSV